MTNTIDSLFDTGLERYKAGESVESLIPVFKEVCDRSPKASSAWICLAWLYLLELRIWNLQRLLLNPPHQFQA